MNIDRKFHPTTQHGLKFYYDVLTTLMEGLHAKSTNAELAALLKSKGLHAPTGNDWTATTVANALSRLRHYKTYPSHLHSALMRLVFEGFIGVSEIWVFFKDRNRAQAF